MRTKQPAHPKDKEWASPDLWRYQTPLTIMKNQTFYKVAVNSKILANILNAFRVAGVQWDGTINQIDRFCPIGAERPSSWQKLCYRSRKSTVLINYIE
jgi:hypothetical protein